ncbi:hypothetical protein [Alteromonas gracilis]|uniref:hypothetical protein n=1 Tax=Alteromonas gracilis TaxID=1479524 RepID=UPI003736E680
MSKKLKLLDIKRVSKPAAHSAFTDLIENPFDNSRDTLICSYRQATNHVSADGILVVLTIDKNTFQVKYRSTIREGNADLRDPKFSYHGKRLMLTTYAKSYSDDGKMTSRMLTYFSTDGLSWSGKNSYGKSGWWLWNHSWFNSQAYGFAYNRPSNAISLFKGDPIRTMQLHVENVFSLSKQGKGYPNESTILFDELGNASVFLRRDADTFSAQFGTSKPPFTKWTWHDLGIYIGGPAAVWLGSDYFIVAGRYVDWATRTFSTKLWLFNANSKKLEELYTMPSSGDTSYPGLVIQDDILYISYYSCHIDNQARVYMARLSGVKALTNRPV